MNMNHGIRAIFFDFGGVLLRHMDGVDHKAIESRLALPERTLLRCLYIDSRYMDFQVGKCTWEEWVASVWASAEDVCGEKAAEVMRAFWAAERPLNEEMLSLVARLRSRGYRTGIISNTVPGFEERLRSQAAHIVPLFDVRLGSGDLGIAKPDPQIYLHAAETLGVSPHESVFTDDVRKFAEAARGVGMHGFHFRGYEQFVEDLRSIGIEA